MGCKMRKTMSNNFSPPQRRDNVYLQKAELLECKKDLCENKSILCKNENVIVALTIVDTSPYTWPTYKNLILSRCCTFSFKGYQKQNGKFQT